MIATPGCHPNIFTTLSRTVSLVAVLRLATASRYKDLDGLSEAHAFGQQMNMEGVMSDLVRWQSQKQIPLWTALTSVDARRFQVVGENWDWFRFMQA